ncbi:hypothetical protein L195_g039011 [Trifolium pratense]|uniref:Uncharacterized protein n=1 Tax=Trifolium pratense TaxID=57577 RepID=A0A2K3LWS3_TRIPR|nr:hypothetical protein L195_g039011 [Trifolium pratense]
MGNQRNCPRMRSKEEDTEDGDDAVVVVSASSQHYEQIREQNPSPSDQENSNTINST